MPLNATHLVAPNGEIEAALFPGEAAAALQARLTTYLAEAYANPAVAALATTQEQDNAARQWAYHRAKKAIWLLLSRSAASVAVEGEMSQSRLVTQIQNFGDEAERHLAAFQAIIAPAALPEALPASTSSTSHEFAW